MTLETLKEEYKKSINFRQMDSQDSDALVKEINDATTLYDFLEVVKLWAISDESAERIVLSRILSV